MKDENIVLHVVWTYTIKDLDKQNKAQCACDGSMQGDTVQIINVMHVNFVDHTESMMFYTIPAV